MLDDEFIQYCKLNNIEDIEKFAKQVFNRGFTLIKYGSEPPKKSYPLTEGKIKTNVKQETNSGLLASPPPPIPIIKKQTDIYDE